MKDKTSDWALASRAHFRGAYLFGLLAFVLLSLMFNSLMLTFLFTARPLTVYKHFVCFFSGVQKKISNTKELKTMGMFEKKKKKRTNASIKKKKKNRKRKKRKVQHMTSQNEELLCYFQNSGIEQCCLVQFNLLCSVLMLISWTIWSRTFYVDIFFLYIYILKKKIRKKKKKKKHNCSLSCTHEKVDLVSGRPGFQSTNSTPF